MKISARILLTVLPVVLLLSGCSQPSDPVTSPKPATSVDTEHNNYTVGAVFFSNATVGWVGGDGFIFKTHDGGQHWEVQDQRACYIKSLSFLNPNVGWALGIEQGSSSDPESDARVLLHTVDGGQHWNVQAHPSSIDEIHFISEQVGFGGSQVTQDGGKTWNTLPTPPNMLGAPYFVDPSSGWALTADSDSFHVQRTTDGGKSWVTTLTRPEVNPGNLDPRYRGKIRSTSPTDAWVEVIGSRFRNQTSYSLFHTADAGTNWTTVIEHSTAGAGPAPGSVPDSKGQEGPLDSPDDLYAVNAETAFLSGTCTYCGFGKVAVGGTQDGGKTWTNFSAELPGAYSLLSFVDAQHGWLAATPHGSASVLYETANGGQTWQQKFVFGSNSPQY